MKIPAPKERIISSSTRMLRVLTVQHVTRVDGAEWEVLIFLVSVHRDIIVH